VAPPPDTILPQYADRAAVPFAIYSNRSVPIWYFANRAHRENRRFVRVDRGAIGRFHRIGGRSCFQSEPEKLVTEALADFRSATSVHCLFSGGSSSESLTLSGDLFRDGDVNGAFGLNEYSTRLIVIRGSAYEQVNAALISLVGKLGIETSALLPLSGKWISGPNSTSNGSGSNFHFSVATSLSFASLVQIFGQSLGSLTQTGHSTIDGHPAIRIRSSQHATIWISETAKPYPVKLSATADGGSIAITLSAWNKAHMVRAPTDSAPISSISLPLST